MKTNVKRRKIKGIFHFTQLSNLDGILTHGLLGRNDLQESGLPVDINDPYRYDYQKNAICCSVGHPNYKMFYSLRQKDLNIKWVVLGLKKSILWKKDCAFCFTNAANSNVTSIPIQNRKGVSAFNKMFEEIIGKPTREELKIADRCPTDPQAEILVLENIQPQYIIGVFTNDREVENSLSTKYPSLQVKYNNRPFSYRHDYEHWR